MSSFFGGPGSQAPHNGALGPERLPGEAPRLAGWHGVSAAPGHVAPERFAGGGHFDTQPHEFASQGFYGGFHPPDELPRHWVEMSEERGWYHAESGRIDGETMAKVHIQAICETVDRMHAAGQCFSKKWTNDPEVIPDHAFPSVVPFPPDDHQLHVRTAVHDDRFEQLAQVLTLSEDHHEEAQASVKPWIRLPSYSQNTGASCGLFNNQDKTHCGRIYQGHLENAYFVEALNAISLRPKLARRLFHNWDVARGVYIVRLFKNGVWMRVEVDDFVPVRPEPEHLAGKNAPFCCRSEHFPFVLWPSLVEKAYAKANTLRIADGDETGGWEAVGGGGNVEEALADLTGGVAGRFYCEDVSPDRLFIYFYELQRYCLWVCRVNHGHCIKRGVRFSPISHYSINRAATYEGHCFLQIFCASETGVHDGGLEHFTVPAELLKRHPETIQDGFFWITIEDFQYYFDTIFECRLVNSPDVGIDLMPPPKLPNAINPLPPGIPGPGPPPQRPVGGSPDDHPLFFETVHANSGRISEANLPEITCMLPPEPCEVGVSLEQTDLRILQVGPSRPPHVPVKLKVFQVLEGQNVLSEELVCKSNFLSVRDAVVVFKCNTGGMFKVLAELPRDAEIDRMICRCYASVRHVTFNVRPNWQPSKFVTSEDPPRALKWTLIGSVQPGRLANPDCPEPLGEDLDAFRRRNTGTGCSVM